MSQLTGSEYSFPVPGAARLASLAGLKADLEQVDDYCSRMIERYAGSHLKQSPFDIVGFTTHIDFVDWAALSTAACISYARCFVSGVRQSLDPDLLPNADPELRDTHDFILHVRNKHVAHSVNSFEENTVTVHVGHAFRSSGEIRAVVPRHERAVGLQLDGPAKLQRLAQWWIAQVREEIAREAKHVLLLAQSTPLEDIRAIGPFASRPTDTLNANVGKRRRGP